MDFKTKSAEIVALRFGHFDVELELAITTALAEAVAAERGGLAQGRAALRAAREEIQWWVNEHRCCQGHEFEALAKIEDALGE